LTIERPWELGDAASRWLGYLWGPDSGVLRNTLGIVDAEQLQAAEDDLVEYRLAELRADPTLVKRTYDLSHVQALHRQLFQDVYEWAGELRTVGLARDGGESFMPPAEIGRPVAHAAQRIADSDLLRGVTDDHLAAEVAYLYDYMNFAHPFREGNGRTQREFFAQLLAESGRGLEWGRVEREDLHAACHAARNNGDDSKLVAIFTRILTCEPIS